MTLLNHIGVFLFIFLFEGVVLLLSPSIRRELKITTYKDIFKRLLIEPFLIWFLFEAFYWTFKIFF